MTVWTKLSKEIYAVAVFSFQPRCCQHLGLEVGETVLLLGQTVNWYWGRSLKCDSTGAFPRNYVKIQRIVDKNDENVCPSPADMVVIMQTLNEWLFYLKKLYAANDEKYGTVLTNMRILMNLHSQITSGKLPQEKLKKFCEIARYHIDSGNRALGFEIVIRNDRGQLLKPLDLTVIELNRLHADVDSMLSNYNKSDINTMIQSTDTKQCKAVTYTFVGKVIKFIGEHADLEMCWAIYDDQYEKLTENVVIQWYPANQYRDKLILSGSFVFADLSTEDVERNVYLVCRVSKIIWLDTSSDRRRTLAANATERVKIRRPLGVSFVKINSLSADQDKYEYMTLHFFMCEKEDLDTVFRNVIANPEYRKPNPSRQMVVKLHVAVGSLKQIVKEAPDLVRNSMIARTLNLPEEITPDEVRNDLYVTLQEGFFTKEKFSDKSIEIVVKVIDKHGKTIPYVISHGANTQPQSVFTSAVYYHEDRPKWKEDFKICLKADMFEEACIVFFFRQLEVRRSFSSHMSKDSERFFAVSFLRLIEERKTKKFENRKKRPVLSDTDRSLMVYKIEYKRNINNFDVEEHLSKICQNLVSLKKELRPEAERGSKWVSSNLSSLPRHELRVSTKLSSTQLTQRDEILDVLEWKCLYNCGQLQDALRKLQYVPGAELVKFLHEILNALFSILIEIGEKKDFTENSFSVLVLECLLSIFSLLGEQRFIRFRPVLQAYIDKDFCLPSAYELLLPVIEWEIKFSAKCVEARQRLRKCLKYFDYLMRFVVRSVQNQKQDVATKEETDIFLPLKNLLELMISLMQRTTAVSLVYQAETIKNLPATVRHLVKVVSVEQLSECTVLMFNGLPHNKITSLRLRTYINLLDGPLGLSSASRKILIPHITTETMKLLEGEIETKFCIELFGALINLLARKDIGPVEEDRCHLTRVTINVLPRIAKMKLQRRRENGFTKEEDDVLRQLLCTIMDILRNINEEYYRANFVLPSKYSGTTESEHLANAFHMMREQVEQQVFPPYWADMLQIQHCIMLHALSLIRIKLTHKRNTLKESMSEIQMLFTLWFQTTSTVAISTPLQIENERAARRKRVIQLFGDLRIKAANLMSQAWYSLGEHKCNFIETLIRPLLRVSFIQNNDVRNIVIPIIFDMIVVLYRYTSKSGSPNLNLIKEILINEVEKLVTSGYGDEDWGRSFIKICGGMCASVSHELMEVGGILVAAVGRQLNSLIKYRSVPVHQRVHLISNLLNFYEEIERPDMYLRYVHHLGDLHRQAANWTEAGLTQHLHAKLLQWSEIPLPQNLCHPSREFTKTHLQLKISLYEDAVELLSQGHQSKLAGSLLQELVPVHEHRGHHKQLADLHERLSNVYRLAAEHPMITSPYFRVRYVGLGFPDYLRNPLGFVYRGKEFEKLQGFKESMLEEWPDAEVMLKLDEPGQELTESDGQYLQISSLTAVMSEKWNHLLDCKADEDVIRYYEHNDVDTFQFDRPFYRSDDSLVCNTSDSKVPCEFATRWLERTRLTISGRFPGILRCYPVESSKTFFVSPLEHAVEAMEMSNKELKRAITDDTCKETMMKNLTLKLNGILDARVQGGLENYERTFFTERYLAYHPDHAPILQQLKDRISEQVPLLEQGLEIFEVHDSQNVLHAHLVQRYLTVYGPYGATYNDEKTQLSCSQSMVVVRQRTSTLKSDSRSTSRLSDLSSGNESIVSKMSTATRRNLTNKIFWLRNTSTQTSTRAKPSKTNKRQSRLSVQYESQSISAMSDVEDVLVPPSALCRRCSQTTRLARRQSQGHLNKSIDCLLDETSL